MPKTFLARDADLASQLERSLTSLLNAGNPLPGIEDEDGGVEVNVIETYTESMQMTGDKGLILTDAKRSRTEFKDMSSWPAGADGMPVVADLIRLVQALTPENKEGGQS